MEAIVGPDGQIHLSVPGLAPGEGVHVSIALASPPEPKRPAADIPSEASGHPLFKTAEEVAAYINAERDSWDR
jgi:hypothetical protein